MCRVTFFIKAEVNFLELGDVSLITKSGLLRMHCKLQVKKRVATHPMFDEDDASVATALAEYSSLLLAASLRGSHREKNLIYTQRLNALWYTFLRVCFQASKLAQCTPLALHIMTILFSLLQDFVIIQSGFIGQVYSDDHAHVCPQECTACSV